jgi:hypothetical protein
MIQNFTSNIILRNYDEDLSFSSFLNSFVSKFMNIFVC